MKRMFDRPLSSSPVAMLVLAFPGHLGNIG